MANELLRKLSGYSLVTAEILYRMPDHQSLIQSFIWQDYDKAPQFPELRKFLHFWQEKLDGPLYRVSVAYDRLVKPSELRIVKDMQHLH